jgi:biopolymer transport protein ExbB
MTFTPAHPVKLVLVTLAFSTAAPALAEGALGPELDKAYRREFAFLEEERRALEQRLEAISEQSEARQRTALAELEALHGQVLAASAEADRLSSTLSDTERQAEGLADKDGFLENLLQQAATTLERGGVTPREKSADDVQARSDRLDGVFAEAVALLERHGQVRSEPGDFFAADGSKVSGTLVRVGAVAAYGVSEQAAGALAPAGEASLKVWSAAPSAASANGLFAGQPPATLQLFLFESLDKAIEARARPSALQHIATGGVLAWVIVAGGLLALLMVIARALFLLRASANTERLLAEIAPRVAGDDVAGAISICERAPSAAGRVFCATLQHLSRSREDLDDVMAEAMLQEQPTLERFSSAILMIAAVSPLLGLLGTVTGMIATFDVITEFGTGNPKLMSGGISEALVTTELGLIAAIPALLLGSLLSGWADNIRDGLDKGALRIANIAAGGRARCPPPDPLVDELHRERAAWAR